MRIYFGRKNISGGQAGRSLPPEPTDMAVNNDSLVLQKRLDAAQRDIERGEGVIEVSPTGVAGEGKVGFNVIGDLD